MSGNAIAGQHFTDRVRDGTKLTLTGVTADNFLEVKSLVAVRYLPMRHRSWRALAVASCD